MTENFSVRTGAAVCLSLALLGCIAEVKLSKRDKEAFDTSVAKGDAAARSIEEAACPVMGSNVSATPTAPMPLDGMRRIMESYEKALDADLAGQNKANKDRQTGIVGCQRLFTDLKAPELVAKCSQDLGGTLDKNPKRWGEIHLARSQAMGGDIAVAYASWVKSEWQRLAETSPQIVIPGDWAFPVADFIRRADQANVPYVDTPNRALRKITLKHHSCIESAYVTSLEANQWPILRGMELSDSSRQAKHWRDGFTVGSFNLFAYTGRIAWLSKVDARVSALEAQEAAKARAERIEAWDKRFHMVGQTRMSGAEVRARWKKYQEKGPEIRKDLIATLGETEGLRAFNESVEDCEKLMASREREIGS